MRGAGRNETARKEGRRARAREREEEEMETRRKLEREREREKEDGTCVEKRERGRHLPRRLVVKSHSNRRVNGKRNFAHGPAASDGEGNVRYIHV